MARQTTPNTLLTDVSQETRPASSLLVDIFGEGPAVPVFNYHDVSEMVPLDAIDDNPYQPRVHYNAIDELAENIRQNGLLQPPAGRRLANGRVQLAFGHRRLRAYRTLREAYGLDWGRMPVVIRSMADDSMAKCAWSENHNREDVSPIEEARLFQRMIDDFGVTQQEIATDVGKSRPAVANTLRLLQLPQAAQTLIDSGIITERHGRELLRLVGAPTWLQKHLADLMDDQRSRGDVRTVSDLKRQIDQYIKLNGVFMPEEPIDAPDRYDDKKQHLPPAWGWGYAPKSPDVVGPCRFCPQLVNFGGDPAPRCTNGTCYQAKKRIWTDNERERQRAAALTAANAAAAAAPAPAQGQRKQQTAEPAAPRAIEKIEQQGYAINLFRQGDSTAPATLLEHGLCGKDQCECFCLARFESNSYRSIDKDKYVRPDPVNAPDVAYACKSAQTLAARRRRLEAIVEPAKAVAENERRAELSKQTRDTKELLREFWEEIGPEGLVRSANVLSQILVRVSPVSNDGYKGKSLAEMWDKLFWSLAQVTCQRTEYHDSDRIDRWHVDLAEKWTAQIRAEIAVAVDLPAAPPAHQPAPGDSQKTGWENGWDDMDAGLWALLTAYPGPILPENVDQPRVLLRAIEITTDKDTRGALWRRHNQLTQVKEADHA